MLNWDGRAEILEVGLRVPDLGFSLHSGFKMLPQIMVPPEYVVMQGSYMCISSFRFWVPATRISFPGAGTAACGGGFLELFNSGSRSFIHFTPYNLAETLLSNLNSEPSSLNFQYVLRPARSHQYVDSCRRELACGHSDQAGRLSSRKR